MSEFLHHLKPGELPGVIVAALMSVTIIVAIVANQWRKVRVAEQEAALKQTMLERGMSAEEIVRVLTASGRAASPVPPPAFPVKETAEFTG